MLLVLYHSADVSTRVEKWEASFLKIKKKFSFWRDGGREGCSVVSALPGIIIIILLFVIDSTILPTKFVAPPPTFYTKKG